MMPHARNCARWPPQTIVEKANKQRKKMAIEKLQAPIAGSVYFTVARTLPSRDVAIEVDTAKAADLLRRFDNPKGWLAAFGKGAQVQMPTWGVVVHNVPVHRMALAPEDAIKVAEALKHQNRHT